MLETYFKLPNLPSGRLDVLAWWKPQEPVLPLLAEIDWKYLCIPASSAPSERLFTASGNMMTKIRLGVHLYPKTWRWWSTYMET